MAAWAQADDDGEVFGGQSRFYPGGVLDTDLPSGVHPATPLKSAALLRTRVGHPDKPDSPL